MRPITVCFVLILIFSVYGEKRRLLNKNQGIHQRLLKYNVTTLKSGIMGGKEVLITKHPYLLSVEANGIALGGAVVLNKKWIITAGNNVHYYTADALTIRLGSSKALSGGQEIKAETIVKHPDYTGTWRHDLALIKLSKPLQFSQKVKPISLAKSLPGEGKQAVVAGYGAKDYSYTTDGILREAVVPVMRYKTCKQHYKRDDFTQFSFCTFKENVGPCLQDFGDPLVYKKKLIGIFSGPLECGIYPAVYADVTQYGEWINSVIKS